MNEAVASVSDMPSNPILVALDMPTAEEAVRMARSLAPHVGGFKVGLELLMGPGPAVVAAVAEFGKPVFCDAKLHDIPNTVEQAARQVGRLGARWLTVHAGGGESMMAAAVAGFSAIEMPWWHSHRSAVVVGSSSIHAAMRSAYPPAAAGPLPTLNLMPVLPVRRTHSVTVERADGSGSSSET